MDHWDQLIDSIVGHRFLSLQDKAEDHWHTAQSFQYMCRCTSCIQFLCDRPLRTWCSQMDSQDHMDPDLLDIFRHKVWTIWNLPLVDILLQNLSHTERFLVDMVCRISHHWTHICHCSHTSQSHHWTCKRTHSHISFRPRSSSHLHYKGRAEGMECTFSTPHSSRYRWDNP